MSWSVSLIGHPTKIALALEKESERLTGQCKLEFDAAKPHLLGLLNQNFADTSNETLSPPVLRLHAHGSGYSTNGKQIHRNCRVTLEDLTGQLVA